MEHTLSHPDLPTKWNSRSTPEKVTFLKKALQFESQILKTSASTNQAILTELQQEHQTSLEQLRQEHTQELQRQMETIDHKEQLHQEQLRETRQTYQEQIQELRTRIQQLDADYRQRQDRDIKHIQDSMEREREQYREQLRELRQQVALERTRSETELTTKINEIHAYQARVKDNSAIAGQFGENDYLQWSLAELRSVDTKDNNADNLKHCGDFIHTFANGVRVMVDTKNYAHPVSARERRKLASDMRANPEVDAGVLLSFSSCIQGFAGDEFFSLERLDDGRPILYIHYFGRNRGLYTGILRMMVRHIADAKQSGISDITEIRNRIDTCLREHVHPHLRQIKMMRKTLGELEKSATEMERNVGTILGTLDMKN